MDLGDSGLRLIFVIEDDEAVRASTRTLLEASGFAVRTFTNAEELLVRPNPQRDHKSWVFKFLD